jgi:hypothetical protein
MLTAFSVSNPLALRLTAIAVFILVLMLLIWRRGRHR